MKVKFVLGGIGSLLLAWFFLAISIFGLEFIGDDFFTKDIIFFIIGSILVCQIGSAGKKLNDKKLSGIGGVNILGVLVYALGLAFVVYVSGNIGEIAYSIGKGLAIICAMGVCSKLAGAVKPYLAKGLSVTLKVLSLVSLFINGFGFIVFCILGIDADLLAYTELLIVIVLVLAAVVSFMLVGKKFEAAQAEETKEEAQAE